MTWNRGSLAERYGSPSKRVVVNLTDQHHAVLECLADAYDTTVSEMVRRLIDEKFREEGTWAVSA